MAFEVVWSNSAIKQARKIPVKQRYMIYNWVETHLEGSQNPKAILGSKAMPGYEDVWRYRVGSYRVIAHIYETQLVIEVVKVGHRQGVYSNLPGNL